jgi:phosphate transport system permease protein
MNRPPKTRFVEPEAPLRTIDKVNASLGRRHAAERHFRALGLGAVVLGLSFVAMLFVSIVGKGYTAFQQTYIELPVSFDTQVIDPDGRLRAGGLDATEVNKALLGVNFLKLARDALKAEFPNVSGRSERRALYGLLSPGAPLQLRDLVIEDPSVIGSKRRVRLLADDDVDMFMKGRSTPVRISDGEASATVSIADDGKTAAISADDDAFAPLAAEVRALLERRAEASERELERLERSRDGLRERLAAVTDAGLREELTRRIADSERRIERETETLKELRRRAAPDAGPLNLDADMPSWLVRIGGGTIEVETIAADRLTGKVLIPPVSSPATASGNWQIVELTTPADDRRLKDGQIAWVLDLQQQGLIQKRFNTIFFTHGASREPELAGIAGALMGSFYTLVLTLLFSFPIAVGAAVYLEEFAPKNRFTDLIEVNINNLAAVPSIVFGLLGLAVFINFFGVPRSTPLVAAMVLTLMTLPTIIIASRAALKSVPPSIREAALGVGASPLQAQVHHVLPLALPGMLTGTIIGMAQALGETAPLLMIGMIAFIVDIPHGFTDPSTVLPVQIFLWADSPERGFVERTSAAIIVLLGFLILMNLAAVLLRRRFERRW